MKKFFESIAHKIQFYNLLIIVLIVHIVKFNRSRQRCIINTEYDSGMMFGKKMCGGVQSTPHSSDINK